MGEQLNRAGRPRDWQTTSELALALDGELPDRDDGIDDAYRAALRADGAALQPSINRLRAVDSAELVVASHGFDDVARLLTLLGVSFTHDSTCESISRSTIVFLGCSAVDQEAERTVARSRQAGATIVSSDRAATLAGIHQHLRPKAQAAARTARVRRDRIGVNDPASTDDWEGLGLLPVVLSPGHVPVAVQPSRSRDARHLVVDGMTGESLVVLLRVSGCKVLHSVPHWWQSGRVIDTAVDRRLLREIPAFRSLGLTFPDVTFGQFSAARVMLSAFLLGLGMALDQDSRPEGA